MLVVHETDLHVARKIIAPLGIRHPGLDIQFNMSTAQDINRRCRGPYWLTFLGNGVVETLGGVDELTAALPKQASVLTAEVAS